MSSSLDDDDAEHFMFLLGVIAVGMAIWFYATHPADFRETEPEPPIITVA